MNIVFDRSIFVELKLTVTPAAGVFMNFLDVPQLRGVFVQGIEAFTDSQLTKTPIQSTVFANAAAKEMVMSFTEGSDIRYENIPYYTLVAANNGGLIRKFKNFKININKSGVWMGGATATVNHALAFVVYYTKRAL